jgi:23S rRNA pseudouridine2605 synthase
MKDSRQIGLARALSKLGYCSRSQAFDLVRSGRVQVNGAIRHDPESRVRPKTDRFEVDGQPVLAAAKIYLMMNKPRGAVTTASDEQGRQTVYAFLDAVGLGNESRFETWIAPVGRLDKASEGLLLLTNDSEWAAQVTSPASHLGKTYHVQIDAVADAALLKSIGKGVKTPDGEFLGVTSVRIVRGGKRNTWLEIVLDEGRNRHIRRMLHAFGIEVLSLVRVAIGPLPLGQLPKGSARSLTGPEKQALDKALREKVAPTTPDSLGAPELDRRARRTTGRSLRSIRP